MTIIRRTLSAASLTAFALSGGSIEAKETTSGVNLNATTGATFNPYLTETDAKAIGVVDAEIRPWAHIESVRTTFDLTAHATGRFFSKRYDTEDSEGASISFRSKRSDRTSIYGSAKIDSASTRTVIPRSGATPGVTDPVNPVDPQTLPTEVKDFIPGDDVTLLGLTGRTTSLSAEFGIDHQVGTRSFFGASAEYQRLMASGRAGIGYDSFKGGVNYFRQVTEHTRVGAQLTGRRTNYAVNGQSTIIVAEGTMEQRLSSAWTLSAAAGLSTARTDATGTTISAQATGLSGLVKLCNDQPSRNFCVQLDRSQLPGAFGRARRVDNAVATFSERLSIRDRLDVAMRYGRSEAISGSAFTDPRVTIASVDTTYTRTLGERVEGYAFVSLARYFSPNLTTDPSFNTGFGVRLRLGKTR